MAEAYLTFKGTTAGIVDAFYPTQALADAGATDTDITAVQGVQTIPDNYVPNKAYWDGTALQEEQPETVTYDALTGLEKLKASCRTAWANMAVRDRLLEAEGVARSGPERSLARTFTGYARQWLYLVATNTRVDGQADWTLAEREKAAELIGGWPDDVTDAYGFYQALKLSGGGLITEPTGPVGWVNVGDGTTDPLAHAIGTTTNMMLDTTKLPNTSIADGSWMEEIAS